MNIGYVYILSNIKRSILYVGVTSNINRRIWDHKQGEGSLFTKKYRCTILLYAEEYDSISDAIAREKQLKSWKREWKWELIKKSNPELVDWYPTLRG
jgi:putative endonuclease